MSDTVKHLVVADMLGETSSRLNMPWLNTRIAALTVGVTSHAILDYMDNEFVVNWFNFQELKYALPFLAVQISLSLVVLWLIFSPHRFPRVKNRKLRIFFLIGGVLPDLIDGVYALVNPQAWYNGQLLFPWHISEGTGVEPMSMYTTIILTAGLVLLRYTLFAYIIKERVKTRA